MKIVKLISIVFISSLFIIGCSTLTVKPRYFQSVGETDAGILLKAYVGDILYTKYDYESRDFVRLTFENSCGLGCTLVATDTVFMASSVDGQIGACGLVLNRKGLGIVLPVNAPMNVCVVDGDMNGDFEKWAHTSNSGSLKIAIPYNFQTADRVRGKKKELIYQGKEEVTLRFRYREYINDIVRPAYDQTVEYNIGEDNLVTFRGMKIQVQEANNQEITYRIVSGTVDL